MTLYYKKKNTIFSFICQKSGEIQMLGTFMAIQSILILFSPIFPKSYELSVPVMHYDRHCDVILGMFVLFLNEPYGKRRPIALYHGTQYGFLGVFF